MRIDNEYIKNHPAEKPPTGEFATTPYAITMNCGMRLLTSPGIYHEIKGRFPH